MEEKAELKCLFQLSGNSRHVILTTSARAEMTFPSVVRDLLMFAPSCSQQNVLVVTQVQSKRRRNTQERGFTLSRVPLAPVESARSLPARSTRLILLTCSGERVKHAVSFQGE